MNQHLTDAIVKKLPRPLKGNKVHYDSTVRGFGISITRAGARSFIFNYRVRATGRERRIVIGRFSDWMTTAARDEAKRLRRQIDAGGDPLAGIEALREAPTMADLIERFEAEHLPRRRPETARGYKVFIKRHIKPHFGQHMKVADVTFSDIDNLHRKISKSGAVYTANRTVAVLSKMFSLAIKWKMRSDNPTKGIELNPEHKRRRYLKADELVRLTTALAAHPNQQAANIIRLLLLTGRRRMEAMSARWGDLDLTAGIWSEPASSSKRKTTPEVPLSGPARQLLADIAGKQKPLGEFVFPSDSKQGHVVELAKTWRTICEAAGITGLRVHDLRHNFASELASSGASLPLIGALLGHSSPSTTARYAHLFIDPQRAAVERVGAIIDNAGKDAVAPTPLKQGR